MIEIDDLNKTYGLGKIEVHALKQVNIKVEQGEFVSVMGPSGSGKSTLLNILGCLDRPTNGGYQLDGVLVSSLSDVELAGIRNQKIGFVFQSFNLLPRFSALHNVELPMIYSGIHHKERKERAIEALDKVGLKERMLHKPNELSGGQKQRVAIARALVNQPAILLADEPTGNLDSTSSIEIMAIFQKLNQEGVTIILVTHEEDIALHTKRVIRFRDGRIESDEQVESPLIANPIEAEASKKHVKSESPKADKNAEILDGTEVSEGKDMHCVEVPTEKEVHEETLVSEENGISKETNTSVASEVLAENEDHKVIELVNHKGKHNKFSKANKFDKNKEPNK